MKRYLSILMCLAMLLGCVPFAATAETAEEPITLTMFVDEYWWPYKDWSGDMPAWFTEQTGITFDVQVAADATELAMMVASGELPDIIVSTQFNMLANADLCYDWEDLIKEYNIDAAIHPAYKFVNTAADGKFYTIRVGWSADYEFEKYPTAAPEGTTLCMRKDILDACMEKLGIKEITTVDQLEQCFDACKALYPDVVPFTIHDPNDPTRWMETLYGAGHKGFVDKDGKAELWLYDENYKTVLMKMNEWFRKGYASADNLSWNGITIAIEQSVAGKVFAFASNTSAPQNLNTSAAQAGLDYTYPALTTLFTDTTAELNTETGFRGFYITKDCKNPEAAIKAALFFRNKDTGYRMLWGFEGEDWSWNEDKTEATIFWTRADTELCESRRFYWGWLGHDAISTAMQNMSVPANREAYIWTSQIAKRMPTLGLVMNQMDSESEEYIEYQNILELNKLYANKIMLAATEEEAQALYDEMIANADNLGGQALNDWANAIYPDLAAQYETVRAIGEEGWQK